MFLPISPCSVVSTPNDTQVWVSTPGDTQVRVNTPIDTRVWVSTLSDTQVWMSTLSDTQFWTGCDSKRALLSVLKLDCSFIPSLINIANLKSHIYLCARIHAVVPL